MPFKTPGKNTTDDAMFILNDNELKRLTGKIQKGPQCKALRLMGVAYGERLDGWPVVTREAVLNYTGVGKTKAKKDALTINLDAL